jgi:hypothetical protein
MDYTRLRESIVFPRLTLVGILRKKYSSVINVHSARYIVLCIKRNANARDTKEESGHYTGNSIDYKVCRSMLCTQQLSIPPSLLNSASSSHLLEASHEWIQI